MRPAAKTAKQANVSRISYQKRFDREDSLALPLFNFAFKKLSNYTVQENWARGGGATDTAH